MEVKVQTTGEIQGLVDEPVRTSAQGPTPTDLLIEGWFFDTFHNVPGLTTEMFNRFRAAADDLKARLRAEEK